MNINQVSALDVYRDALNALGFSGEDSLEQLLGVAQAAGPELAAYLGVSVSVMINTVNAIAAFASAIPQNALNVIHQATYSLGVAIDHVPLPNTAPSITAPTAPAATTVNLISNMPSIRNQGARGTCVAHAALTEPFHMPTSPGWVQKRIQYYRV